MYTPALEPWPDLLFSSSASEALNKSSGVPRMSIARRVAVVGGTGFLGTHVCRLAVQSGLQVVSISRSGNPPSAATRPDHFSTHVDWKACNVLEDPEGLAATLADCDATIIAVGALFADSAYKTAVGVGGEQREKARTGSHEQENRDTALRVLDAVGQIPQLQHVTFVSAGNTLGALHAVSRGYLEAKREAENALLIHPGVRVATVLRPGIMYSDERPLSILAGGGVKVKRAIMGGIEQLSWAVQDEPLPVETVAAACVQSIMQRVNPVSTAEGGQDGEEQAQHPGEWPEYAEIMDIQGIVALSEAGGLSRHKDDDEAGAWSLN